MVTLSKYSLGLASILAVGSAIAQSPLSGPTPNNGMSSMTLTAQDFVTKATLDGLTEVQLAQMALKQSQNSAVKQFAQQIVTDHTQANSELKAIAQRKSLQVPSMLDQEHNAIVQAMASKSGSDFDATYSRDMVSAHDKAITLFTGGGNVSDPVISAYAKKTLPTLQNHRAMAGALASKS